jgi:membrane-associated HD superfamily phosphohydrolase
MIDNTDNTAVAAPVTEPKRKRTRGPLNQGHLRKLTKAEGIGQAAQNNGHAAVLAERDITAPFVAEFLDDTEEARTKAADAVMHGTSAKDATAKEDKAAHLLLAAMQEVQKAAKQKYARTNRIALGDFFIGRKLNGNRPNLLQTSQTIINKVAADTLPGITAAKKAKLKTLRQAWIDANATKSDSSTFAQTARAELKTMIKSIEDRRVAIQLAADAEWPHTEPEHAAIRKEFGLSPRTPFRA